MYSSCNFQPFKDGLYLEITAVVRGSLYVGKADGSKKKVCVLKQIQTKPQPNVVMGAVVDPTKNASDGIARRGHVYIV